MYSLMVQRNTEASKSMSLTHSCLSDVFVDEYHQVTDLPEKMTVACALAHWDAVSRLTSCSRDGCPLISDRSNEDIFQGLFYSNVLLINHIKPNPQISGTHVLPIIESHDSSFVVTFALPRDRIILCCP